MTSGDKGLGKLGELLTQAVFIEGTSCTFKSTVLQRMRKEGVPCQRGDFAYHSDRYPVLTNYRSNSISCLFILLIP